MHPKKTTDTYVLLKRIARKESTVNWKKVGEYEEYTPPLTRTALLGEPIAYYREKTDHPNRKLYDLYAGFKDTNEIVQIGTNIRDKQCEFRINEYRTYFKQQMEA